MGITRSGKMKTIVSKRGAVEDLNRDIRNYKLTQAHLGEAHQLFVDAAKKLKILDQVCHPKPAAHLSYKEKLRREQAEEALDSLLEHLHRQQDQLAHSKEATSGAQGTLDYDTLKREAIAAWSAWLEKSTSKFKLTSHAKYAEFYQTFLAPKLASPEWGDKLQPERLLVMASQFFNGWLRKAIVKWNEAPRPALEKIVTAFRSQVFSSRASEGPDFKLVHDLLQGACSQGHFDLLKENMLFGADPLFLDTRHGQGVWHDNLVEDPKFILKVLEDQFTEVQASRGLLFDFSDTEVKNWLLQCGVRVSPVIPAVKKTPHGAPALDDAGDVKLRMCVHCSFGADSPNSGMRPSEHTRQKTTSPKLVVHKAILEEARFPNHPLRFPKHDVAAAFRQVAILLRRVGLFATAAKDFVLINLTMIFGAGPAPGDFEPLGDAVMKVMAAAPQGELPKESSPKRGSTPKTLSMTLHRITSDRLTISRVGLWTMSSPA